MERAFNKLKHWRRIAARYDRRSINILSALYMVCVVIWGYELSICPGLCTSLA